MGQRRKHFPCFYLKTYGIVTALKFTIIQRINVVNGENAYQVNQVKYKYAYAI